MKTVLTAVAALTLFAFAVAQDCSMCKAMMKVEELGKSPMGNTMKLSNGALGYSIINEGKNVKDLHATAVSICNMMTKPPADACDQCKTVSGMMAGVEFDVMQGKTGVVVVMTSSKPETVKMLHTMFVTPASAPTASPTPGAANPEKSTSDREDFAGKGDGIETCPVMGMAVKKEHFVEHNGRKVYLCCAMCVGQFKRDPGKYVKN